MSEDALELAEESQNRSQNLPPRGILLYNLFSESRVVRGGVVASCVSHILVLHEGEIGSGPRGRGAAPPPRVERADDGRPRPARGCVGRKQRLLPRGRERSEASTARSEAFHPSPGRRRRPRPQKVPSLLPRASRPHILLGAQTARGARKAESLARAPRRGREAHRLQRPEKTTRSRCAEQRVNIFWYGPKSARRAKSRERPRASRRRRQGRKRSRTTPMVRH